MGTNVAWRAAAVFAGIAFAGIAIPGLAYAQDAAEPAGATPQENWGSQCAGVTRKDPLECSMEQRVVDSQSNRLLATVQIVVPDGGAVPVILIHLPLGIFLPFGLVAEVDGQEIVRLAFQTCDQNGCLTGTQLSEDFLDKLRAGKTLNLRVQNQNQQEANVPVALQGFAGTFDSIR